ncbi:uncharacterized protein L203_100222 [Cryptococcus depauperatus CBS 7841]|uniref:Alpha 1,6-mannosyltransferase n=1 Tax=Cryptococcus depauperatus CBS 7841 TaxID=1295531 RepID=A0AAJ8LWP2_9TREE
MEELGIQLEGSTLDDTDLHTSNKLPNQYQSWTTLNPDWTVLYVEDEMIDSWLADGLKLAENKDSEGPVALKEMLWLKSHWGVIRADLFRYLALFLSGGLYTDTDTASVVPITHGPNTHVYRCPTF